MRRLTLVILSVLVIGLILPGIATAQTPDTSPAASPVAGSPHWAVSDSREIDVDGEPIALSPDGQWLAGLGPGENEVCAWDIETLTPTCAEVDGVVRPYMGNSLLQWAPDSTAFTFASGDMARAEIGEVFVFEPETGELTQLTNNMEEAQALVVGASWTSDSQQVVFAINHGLGDGPTELGRADRAGGSLETIALPDDWPTGYDILTPPRVTRDGSLLVAVTGTDADIAGIWKLDPDGTEAKQLLAAHGEPPVDHPMIVSTSPDDRYANVVSISGMMRLMDDHTYFVLDAESGDLTSLAAEHTPQLIMFAPTSSTGLLLRDVDGELRLHSIDLTTGDILPVADGPDDVSTWLEYMPTWAGNNTAFLPNEAGGTLITLEPAGE